MVSKRYDLLVNLHELLHKLEIQVLYGDSLIVYVHVLFLVMGVMLRETLKDELKHCFEVLHVHLNSKQSF